MKNKFLIFLFFILYYSGSLFCQEPNPLNVEVKYPLKGINTYCPKDNRLLDSSYYEYDSNQKLTFMSNFQLSSYKLNRSTRFLVKGDDSIITNNRVVYLEDSNNSCYESTSKTIYNTIRYGDTLKIRMEYLIYNDTPKIISMLSSHYVKNKLSYQLKKIRIKDTLTYIDSIVYFYENNIIIKKEIYNMACKCMSYKVDYCYLPDSVKTITEYLYQFFEEKNYGGFVEKRTFYKNLLYSFEMDYLDGTKRSRNEYDYENGLLICKEEMNLEPHFSNKRIDIKNIYQYDSLNRPISRRSFSFRYMRGKIVELFEWDGNYLNRKNEYAEVNNTDLGMDIGGCNAQRLVKYSYYK